MACRVMKFVALIVAIAGLASPVAAQIVGDVEIVEQGIYTADIDRTVRGPDGLFRNVLSNICHVVETTTIPARLGLHFGFRYRIGGVAQGRVIDVRKLTLFPTAMQPPGATKPITRAEHTYQRQIGTIGFTGYAFDETSELMPGIWTFQMWLGGRMLSEVKFTVIEDNGMRLPRGGGANCFKVS